MSAEYQFRLSIDASCSSVDLSHLNSPMKTGTVPSNNLRAQKKRRLERFQYLQLNHGVIEIQFHLFSSHLTHLPPPYPSRSATGKSYLPSSQLPLLINNRRTQSLFFATCAGQRTIPSVVISRQTTDQRRNVNAGEETQLW